MRNREATIADLKSGPLAFLGLGFGAGLSPVAPGTVGTLAAVPLYLVAVSVGHAAFVAALVAIVVLGPWICSATARQLEAHDHGAIVWDEIAGYFVTMALVPVSTANVVAGFILFRAFDILKPWPIRWVDRQIHGGTGIMLDDILAGFLAAILLLLLNAWNPGSIF